MKINIKIQHIEGRTRKKGAREKGRAPGQQRTRPVTLPGPVSHAALAGREGDGEPRRDCCLLSFSLRTAAR